jgi:beta-lactamase regulating signal transducer with metallopeptidase domain
MIIPGFESTWWTEALVSHLWQSTVFVFAAWLLALALHRNQAGIPYGVWMAASLKFLLPFSLLIPLGTHLPWPGEGLIQQPAFSSFIEKFAESLLLSAPAAGAHIVGNGAAAGAPTMVHGEAWWPLLLAAIWICGMLFLALRWFGQWWQIWRTIRAALPMNLNPEIPLLLTRASLGPGMFGILRPVLLLHDGVLERLTPSQLDAIVAHELCHLRRRDNLTAVLHMVAETLFWFHPAVWWIRARLIEERERACDEAVLNSSHAALVYAEGILNVCRC